jgi:SNF2 family DNA or RNA helicase
LIPKHTIRLFLNRKLDDNRFYKKLTEKQLQEMCDRLPITPPIWKKLDKHQKVCFLLGVRYKAYAFFADTGMGKSLISIALIRYFQKLGETRHALVLVPNKINKSEWAQEIRKHSPSISFCILRGSSENKWDQLREPATITVDTYAGFMRTACRLVPVLKRKGKKKKKKNRLKPDKELVKQFVKRFDALFLDESTFVKYRGTLVFRICRQISKKVQFRFALTGTPFGSDPVDFWAQMFLVDHGETLGKTLGLYRAAFFSKKESYWSGGYKYTFKKSKQSVLNRILAHRTIRYEVDQSDLPRLIPLVKEVSLPADARVYVQRAQQAIQSAHGNYREMKNAFMRMRQISSGYLGYYDDEEGIKAQYIFPQNPKLDSLLSLVESIRPDRKFIIFNEFTFSGNMICDGLDDLGIGYVRVYGKTKDSDSVLREFNTVPKKQGLVLQNASGSFGLNLQIAKYGIFYESPVSPIIRKQARRRFERQRSLHDSVFQYDLVTRGTYDQRILDSLAAGEDLFKRIVDGRVVSIS